MTVTNVATLEEGTAVVQDLCWLLSFATQSSVMAYEFSLARLQRRLLELQQKRK